MRFRKLRLDDVDEIKPFLKKSVSRTCDYTLGGLFMWRDYYKIDRCVEDGIFYSRMRDEYGNLHYMLPLTDEERTTEAIIKAVEYADKKGIKPHFSLIPTEYLKYFDRSGIPYRATPQESYFDYLYLSCDLRDLKGRRYAGQRNHIHKFHRTSEDWSFDRIDKDNVHLATDFLKFYVAKAKKHSAEFEEENKKVFEVLSDIDRYGMEGGILTQKGEVVGFSLGEIIGDTIYVHIEKSDRDTPGAYQKLVNQFARTFAGDSVIYMNREEDMGDEGLRRSKESYHPVSKLKKYFVEIL